MSLNAKTLKNADKTFKDAISQTFDHRPHINFMPAKKVKISSIGL